MSGKLFLVGTPIGNLSDISPRTAETLAMVDFIAAEDTRVTRKLLSHLDLHKPLISYYEHNRRESAERILPRLLAGENGALVSDAGMPAISDPGEELVKLCAENGVEVITIPGPCALICALAASGLPTQRFAFEGFLAVSGRNRWARLDELRTEPRTLVLYEAPHKLIKTLTDLLKYLGDRDVALCRELTKVHEEVRRTTLSAALAYYEHEPPRGEFVLVIRGAPETQDPETTLEDGLEMVAGYRSEGVSLREAARRVAAETGLPKNLLYSQSLGREDR